MPYIITTRKPAELPHGEHPHDYGYPMRESRRAVATLGEAREACHAALTTCDLNPAAQFDAQYAITYRVSEAGGTIGPLPDGTVIEVRRVLHADAPFMSDAQILDAYNAEGPAPRPGRPQL